MNYKLKKKRIRERTWRLIYLISAVLLAILLVVMGALLVGTMGSNGENRPFYADVHYPSLNILLIVDSEVDGRLDSAVMMRLDVNLGEIIVTALDVDLQVEIGGRNGNLRQHYSYGTEVFLKSAVAELLEIEVDRYAVINRQVFSTMVDNFGGVVFNVAQDLEINVLDGLPIIIDGGISTLTGAQAFSVLNFANWDDESALEMQEILIASIVNARLTEHNLGRSAANFNVFVNGARSNISAMDSVRYLPFLEYLTENERGARALPLVIEDGAITARSLNDFRAIFAD